MSSQQSRNLVQQGYAYLQSNNVAHALEYFTRAINDDPGNYEAWFAVGNLHLQMNKPEQAITFLKRATEISPESYMAHGQLGVALYSLQRLTDAIACYKKVAELEPNNISAYANLAIAYQDTGQREEAVSNSKKVVALNPEFPGGYCLLASSLSTLGEYELSLKYYEKALTFEADHLIAIAGKADSLIKLGNKKAAALIIQQQIDNGVVNPSIAISYARTCRENSEEVNAARYLERVLELPNLTYKQRLQCHFTAGELYDHLDNYDQSFQHYSAGNKLAQRTYDEVKDTAYFNKVIKIFSRESMAKMSRSSERGVTPIFIVGMPRSGTSLVERIIGCHSSVFPAGELNSVPNISNKICASNDSDYEYPDCMMSIDNETVNRLSRTHLDYLSGVSNNAQMVVDKLPHNFLFLGLIELLFPNAKVIHCKRDPLDTCLSNYFQYFSGPLEYPYKLEDIAHHYNNYFRILQHWKDVISLPFFELDYEALVMNQEDETHKLINYLGLPWEDSCLKFNESEQVTRTASYEQVRVPIYTRSIGRWRNYEKHLDKLIDNLNIQHYPAD